jgi:hypothetical protein
MTDLSNLPPRVAELIEILTASAAKIAAQDCRIEADCSGANIRVRVYPATAPTVDAKRSTIRTAR